VAKDEKGKAKGGTKQPGGKGGAGKPSSKPPAKPQQQQASAKKSGGGKGTAAATAPATGGHKEIAKDYVPRMQTLYFEKVVPALMEKLHLKNPMQVPKLNKIVINVGVGKGHEEPKLMESVIGEVSSITGMKPLITKAKTSISNFKLREGSPIGVKVTLRRKVMWEFLDRLYNLAIPRIRDFRGVSDKSFDGRGNYTLGIKEQIIFPEINYDSVEKLHGMDITFVTTARNDEQAREFLRELGMPFRKKDAPAQR